MTFADYNAYRLAVLHLIDGDDTNSASFSLKTLDLMMGLGEARAYRDLRASSMVEPLALAPISTVYTLPDDLIELQELYFDASRPIEIVSLSKLHRMGALSSNASAVYAAQDGDTLKFWPGSTVGTVYGSYYAKPAPLNNITWADATTLARYPEVFIFASLTESAPFLGFDSRMPMWRSKYQEALVSAHQEEMQRVYGGSPLRVRAR
jgi:hypothetical protein